MTVICETDYTGFAVEIPAKSHLSNRVQVA